MSAFKKAGNILAYEFKILAFAVKSSFDTERLNRPMLEITLYRSLVCKLHRLVVI